MTGAMIAPATNLELVVMAAGVVTASDEFAMETVGDFESIRLPHTESRFQ